jgi:hypothetical protein
MTDDRPKPRLGRKTLDPSGRPSVLVAVRVPVPDFDLLYQAARAHRESMPTWVRRALKRELEREPQR